MKKIFSLLILFIPVLIMGEQKYDELVLKMKNQSPNIAFFNYQKYQKEHPEVANLYFHMGCISYDKLKACNPITNNFLFNYYAYNSKLYFQSNIHFLTETDLRKYSDFYYGVDYIGKKLTREDLEKYINIRLDTVAYYKKYGQNLYEAFYKLSKRYEYCVSKFYEFNTKYISVNEALLLVSNDDIDFLKQLSEKADSIKFYIEDFNEALKNFPIEGYSPDFKFYPIDFYRVDGLCNVNFLQNRVLLYDFKSWIDRFLSTYVNRINPLRQNAEDVYGKLLRKELIKSPLSLIYALYQIDERSYVAAMINIIGQFNEQNKLYDSLHEIKDADQGIKILYNIDQVGVNIIKSVRDLESITELDYAKYKNFNNVFIKDSNPMLLMKNYLDSINVNTIESKKEFLEYLNTNNIKNEFVDESEKDNLLKGIANANIIYKFRYLDDLYFLFYEVEGELFVKTVII